jgi:hypothetical protein
LADLFRDDFENLGAADTEDYTADHQWLCRKCLTRFITEVVSHRVKPRICTNGQKEQV